VKSNARAVTLAGEAQKDASGMMTHGEKEHGEGGRRPPPHGKMSTQEGRRSRMESEDEEAKEDEHQGG